jgi:hypothetical protein
MTRGILALVLTVTGCSFLTLGPPRPVPGGVECTQNDAPLADAAAAVALAALAMVGATTPSRDNPDCDSCAVLGELAVTAASTTAVVYGISAWYGLGKLHDCRAAEAPR